MVNKHISINAHSSVVLSIVRVLLYLPVTTWCCTGFVCCANCTVLTVMEIVVYRLGDGLSPLQIYIV